MPFYDSTINESTKCGFVKKGHLMNREFGKNGHSINHDFRKKGDLTNGDLAVFNCTK